MRSQAFVRKSIKKFAVPKECAIPTVGVEFLAKRVAAGARQT